MKDLGYLSYFLGLEVSQDSEGYYLSQAKYASYLLSRACITDCKTKLTPLEDNSKLTSLNVTPLKDSTLYWQLVGSLVYLTSVMLKLLFFMVYASLVSSGYSDANWASDPTYHLSITWYFFFLGSYLFSRCSKK